jgi:hypothetical protein
MSYLVFDTEQAAKDRNKAESKRRGCDMVTTCYWWPMMVNDGGWYLQVNENDEGLTELERHNLTDINNENE